MANDLSTSQKTVPDIEVLEQIISLVNSLKIKKSAEAIIAATGTPAAETYLNLLREDCKSSGC